MVKPKTNYLKAAESADEGVAFIEFLKQRVQRLGLEKTATSNRRADLLAFIQQYDYLRDKRAADGLDPPTPEQYAGEWQVSVRSAFAIYALCREVLGEEPGAVVDVLWDGVGKQQSGPYPVPLMRVRVIVDAS